MKQLLYFLLVFMGGGTGAVLRYGLSLILPQDLFPTAVLSANLIGSLFIGIAWAVLQFLNSAQEWSLLFVTGLLGGFTTFSALQWDVLSRLQQGQWIIALSYLCISIIGGFLLCAAGFYLVKNLVKI